MSCLCVEQRSGSAAQLSVDLRLDLGVVQILIRLVARGLESFYVAIDDLDARVVEALILQLGAQLVVGIGLSQCRADSV